MTYTNNLSLDGFAIFDSIYTNEDVENLLWHINEADSSKDTFRKAGDLFAIRQFLKEVPSLTEIIFNAKLKTALSEYLGDRYFVVKSIYFDKLPTSNWYVSYHQDLTISVDKKISLDGFEFWTVKQGQFAVQPPLPILENVLTVRIHLDDTDENNGALKVIPGSHSKGICRPETIDWTIEKSINCDVSKGGIMLMRPLLLHSSGRTTNNRQRRVIHIEFSNHELPSPLNWSERMEVH